MTDKSSCLIYFHDIEVNNN